MKLSDWLAGSGKKDHEFASEIGVSRVTLWRLKRPNGRLPDRETMEKINAATAGAVTPNDFYDLVDPGTAA